MNLTALDSIASGSLGAVVVALLWLLKHEGQLKGMLDLLPSVAAKAAAAERAVQTSGLAPVVQKVEHTLDAESKALLGKVLAGLGAVTAAPVTDTGAAPEDVPQPTASSDPAPAADAAPTAIQAPTGTTEGQTYTVVGGMLQPAGS